MQADGFSLDDKRVEQDSSKHGNNNIPDIVNRWQTFAGETKRTRIDQSFFVPKSEIEKSDYSLSISTYRELKHEGQDMEDPIEILKQLDKIEVRIQQELAELRELLV
jgi:type I restriction enzyme M protein